MLTTMLTAVSGVPCRCGWGVPDCTDVPPMWGEGGAGSEVRVEAGRWESPLAPHEIPLPLTNDGPAP